MTSVAAWFIKSRQAAKTNRSWANAWLGIGLGMITLLPAASLAEECPLPADRDKDASPFERHLQEGEARYSANDFYGAIASLQNALAVRVTVYAQMRLARAYAAVGEYHRALDIYQRLLQQHTAEIWVLYEMGQTLGWAGHYASAEQAYKKLLALEPGNKGARIGQAQLLAYQARLGEAEAQLADILQTQPDDTEVLLAWAEMDGWQGQWKSALRKYAGILEREPGNAAALRGIETVQAQTRIGLLANGSAVASNEGFSQQAVSLGIGNIAAERMAFSSHIRRWVFSQNQDWTVRRDDFNLAGVFNLLPFQVEAAYTGSWLCGTRHREGPEGLVHSGYAQLTYTPAYRSYLTLRLGRHLVADSMLAINQAMHADGIDGWGDFYLAPGWSGQGSFQVLDYSDCNRRYGGEAQLSFQPWHTSRLTLRSRFSHLHFKNQIDPTFQPGDYSAVHYWTPWHFQTAALTAETELVGFGGVQVAVAAQGEYYLHERALGGGIRIRVDWEPIPGLVMSGNYFLFHAATQVPWQGQGGGWSVKLSPGGWGG